MILETEDKNFEQNDQIEKIVKSVYIEQNQVNFK